MRKFTHFFATLFTLILLTSTAFAQSTTSALSGLVKDADGEPLPGATVIALHTPSGTKYGVATRADGRYDIPNMRVGGPYTITVSYIGFQQFTQEGITLQLGKKFRMNANLAADAETLTEIEVTASADGERTGAATSIDSETIKVLPSISRSTADFTRLTPQSDGNSFGGRNNLYNNFSLDGSIFNNSFGLDVSTPGGQADAQPVSLDAIEQVQVTLAPFDVRQSGFTGAGVNAVTKSGTNEFKGTAYHFFRNENMIGNKVSGTTIENLNYSTTQSGLSLGGPIIKNKLFFFVNGEIERAEGLAHGFVAAKEGREGSNVTSVQYADAMAVKNHFMDKWDYDAGEFENYNHGKENEKLLIKLDWNINDNHNASFRYNMLRAWKDVLPHPEAIGGRGPQPYRLPFSNSSYAIHNNIDSWVAELNSRFGNTASNKFQVTYSRFRDKRMPWSEPFPVIDILDANGQISLTAGSEMFSTNNVLDQDIFQLRDDFTMYMDNHTLTAGFNAEVFQFNNSFNLFYYPGHTFQNVDDFLADRAYNTFTGDYYTVDYRNDVASQNAPYAMAEVDVAQIAFYLQDEWNVSDKLDVTMGVRMDMPIYLSEIAEDPVTKGFDGWKDGKNVDPSTFPTARPLWSPRVGFNYDVKGDQSSVVRGGTGIFTGRIPFVWLGNQASNPKIDPFYTFQVNDTEDDFRFPQVWKTNLAWDKKFANGWSVTLEGIISKDINAVVHRNYNMAAPSQNAEGKGDNRAIFAGFHETNLYSSSEYAANMDDPQFLEAGAIVLENVDEGHQYSLTGQIQKVFDFGLFASAAYTYMESMDYTSIPAEIAADAFQRNPVVGDPNQSQFANSRYGLQHRFITSVGYKKTYGNGRHATSISMFGEIARGNRYSYTYAGDMNRDAIANNDLIYVPASEDEIVLVSTEANTATPTEQWNALNQFIEQDEYLSERRGDYAERNGAMLPWYTQFDVRLLQDYNFKVGDKTNTIQLSVDVLNFGNMLNSDWGVRKLPSTRTPITFEGYQEGTNIPTYSFDTELTETFNDDVSILSKWQMQIGLRYIF
ncbi:TonB-dependent receptor [Sediminitomix flava]|uniref:Carboxypeptidase family protein n=1 Tax=Sediminitomix flava TaxID=379075 RepID=A0A315Z9G5_SEDFL|nr:TonB-dependent receptor [Sediminitomix flava]PWJ42205.1 carboxypeptidase family protein [Sediminitomix flava]